MPTNPHQPCGPMRTSPVVQDLLDLPADGTFDSLAELVRRLIGCRAAVISIVDHDRVFLKSRAGLDLAEVGVEPGLCASAVLQDGPWVVEDASIDPRTLANPLVAGDAGLRFYAGVPLRLRHGENIGMLAAIDFEPRVLTEEQLDSLKLVASIVAEMLDRHLEFHRLANPA